MSQGIFDNIIPSTTSGNQLATLLNSFKDAVVSGFSGTSRPSQLQAGGYWIDTTNDATNIWVFKLYTGTIDVTLFTINTATGVASISSSDSSFEIAKISDDSVGPILQLQKERIASSGQAKVGDTLGEIQFKGTRDDGVNVIQARLKSVSTNDVTSSVQGAYLAFELTTTGGASIAEVMRIVDGKVAIGVTSADSSLHVVGTGIRSEHISDDAVPARVFLKKKRIAGSAQVLSGDVIGELSFLAADNTGAETFAAQVKVSARENQSSSAQGTQIELRNKRIGTTSFITQVTIAESVTVNTDLTITGNLTVNGTTTTINTTTLDVADSNISVNKGGTQSTANTNKAGFKVEMTDATHAQIGYDSTKASKFVIGNVGSEKEIADVSSTQTFTNKTLTSPTINTGSILTPTQLDAKQGTESALTTYAATATNGQLLFATDTKVMYQVIDTALVPLGAGGGGTTLTWNDSGTAPTFVYVDGFKLGNFDAVSNQELFAVLTVPSSYRAGKPIKLRSGQFFSALTSGNVLFKCATALIKSTSVLGTYPNINTSTNTQVTVSGTTNTANAIGLIDLTSSTGTINSVAVAAGDKLRIRLYRDNTNETSGVAGDASLIIDSFEPTFS